MHETIIAKKVIEDARHEANNQMIDSVELEVGQLAPITPDELKRAIKLLIDWDVTAGLKEAIVDCSSCGYSGRPKAVERHHDIVVWECSRCGAKMPDVIEGDKVIIKSIKLK